MHAEEESLSGQRLSKDHSWRIVEISWVLVHPLHHHMLFGRVSRKIHLTHPKQLQMALASMVRWKIAFWQQTHQMILVQTGIKKYPMSTVKYTAGSLMLWACFSAGGPGHLFQIHGIMDSIKYQQIKNLNLTASVRNLIMGRVLIFQQDNNPKHQNKHKNGSLSTKWIFYHGCPCPLTWTLQKMSGWTEEKY